MYFCASGNAYSARTRQVAVPVAREQELSGVMPPVQQCFHFCEPGRGAADEREVGLLITP